MFETLVCVCVWLITVFLGIVSQPEMEEKAGQKKLVQNPQSEDHTIPSGTDKEMAHNLKSKNAVG